MPRLLLAACIAAAASLLWPAMGRAQNLDEQTKLCNGTLTMPPEAVIGACTAIIRSESASTQNRTAAYVNRGVAYAQINDYAHAIADQTAALQLVPDNPAAYKDRGLDRLETRDYAGSLTDLNRYSTLHFPAEPDIVHDIALDDYNLGRAEDALIAATSSITATLSNSSALMLRANIFRMMKMPQFAYLDDEQMAARPDRWTRSIGDLLYRGEAAGLVGNDRRALDDLSAVLKQAPQNVTALSFRCFYLAAANRYADALHDCNVALTIRPNDESTLESRGFTYYKMHHYAKALRDLRAAVALDPSDSDAFFVLGLTERASGSAAAAVRDTARAQQLGRLAPASDQQIIFDKPFPRMGYNSAKSVTFWDVNWPQGAVTSVEVNSDSGRLYIDEKTSWRNQPLVSVTHEVPLSEIACMTPNASTGTVTLVATRDDAVVSYFPQTDGTAATRSLTLQSWGAAAELERLLLKRLPGVHVCRR